MPAQHHAVAGVKTATSRMQGWQVSAKWGLNRGLSQLKSVLCGKKKQVWPVSATFSSVLTSSTDIICIAIQSKSKTIQFFSVYIYLLTNTVQQS